MTIILDAPSALVRRFERESEPSLNWPTAPTIYERITSDPVEETFRPLPDQLINAYVRAAIRRALTEPMEDGRWFAQIPLLPGVWAEGTTEEEALSELQSVALEWTLLKIEDRDRDFPVLESFDLNWL